MPPKLLTPDQLDALKARTPISSLLNAFGHRVRGGFCLCPFHAENTPSCQVFDKEGRIHCYGCGKGGDHFDVLLACKGISFRDAVKHLGGTIEVSDEDKKRFRERREAAERAEVEKKEKGRIAARKLFEDGKLIQKTMAAAYLRNRGLTVSKRLWTDLRFIDNLPYHGFESPKADEQKVLGHFPAMLAAVRDPSTMEIIGCHRTYIDRETQGKLQPPGDTNRNKAKKILGSFLGGLIFLSPENETLIVGEGIETAESGYEFDLGGPDAAVVAGVNIWNICGGTKGTLPNPKAPGDHGTRIPNLEPDPDKPGFIPPPWAKRIILLGDGDSDFHWTRAMMATAAARLKAIKGIEDVRVVFAPTGLDFNDAWVEEQKRAS